MNQKGTFDLRIGLIEGERIKISLRNLFTFLPYEVFWFLQSGSFVLKLFLTYTDY